MIVLAIARVLLVLGRVVGFAGAVLTVVAIVGFIAEWASFSFRHGFQDVGLLPLVLALQIVYAGWVIWGIFRYRGRSLLGILLLGGAGTFLGLYGWYFLLAGEGGELVAIGNLTCLVAGLVVGCGLLASRASARFSNDSP